MSSSQINVRIDEFAKKQAEMILGELGLNMSTAINMFVKQVIAQQGLPFAVRISDGFYNEDNIKHLTMVEKDFEKGVNISKHELIEV